jgi:hypothetical protein
MLSANMLFWAANFLFRENRELASNVLDSRQK